MNPVFEIINTGSEFFFNKWIFKIILIPTSIDFAYN
jgi:hypothetical protein